MSEVYLVFFILQTTIGGVLTVMYAKHENTRFPPAHVKSKISLNLFAMLQCSIYLKILYTPRGVCDIKRQGGCFLETTLLCPEMQRLGYFLCGSLCMTG